MGDCPAVTIGLPVHNGGDQLAQQLDSLLSQTFEDFELVISDNASTDQTSELCNRYASRDARIRYHRYDVDRGAVRNFNNVAELARAPLFVWASHDDRFEPQFLQRTVPVLQQRPDVVLCYGITRRIYDDGTTEALDHPDYRLDQDEPAERFRTIVTRLGLCNCFHGLIRRDVLLQTQMMRDDTRGADNLLLADLALRGKFVLIEEVLFERRIGSRLDQGVTYVDKQARLERISGGEGSRRGVTLPLCRLGKYHIDLLGDVEMPPEQRAELADFVRQVWWRRWQGAVVSELRRSVEATINGVAWRGWRESQETTGLPGTRIGPVEAAKLLREYDEARLIMPQFPGLELARSRVLFVLGLHEDARLACERQIRLTPSLEGICRQWMGQMDALRRSAG